MTTADDWTIIKELDPWRMATLIGLLLAVVSSYYSWGRAWVNWTFVFTRARKLDNLKKRRDYLQRLHDCEREYYGYLLSGILWVLFLLTWQLMIEGLVVSLTYQSALLQQIAGAILTFTRYPIGWIAGLIAINRLGTYRVLRRFHSTMATLNRRIAKLEAKLGVHPAPASV